MIKEMYRKAGELHGHYCPGLAVGVRAAVEALRILEVIDIQSHGLYCIAENRACYIDGIQMLFGTTLGKGNLEIRPMGKAAFNLYDRSKGKGIRLSFASSFDEKSREEMIEFILTAPFEEVFTLGEASMLPPPDRFVRRPSQKCSRCGEATSEPFLRIKDGKTVCLSCMEILEAQATD